MMELKKIKLGEIAQIIGGVSYKPVDITDKGIRILRGGNIQNGILILRNDDVFLPMTYTNSENQVQWGDTVMVASTGSPEVLGKVATVFEDYGRVQIGAFLRIIRPKNRKYAYLITAWLNSSGFKNYIKKQAKGTSINNVRNSHLEDFTLLMPEEKYLESFSRFYATIDKKLRLNRAINRNLEAMAKQLYDYWFVQFDFPDEDGKPYKSSGGKMIWNKKLKRNIPEGWTCGTLLDIANYTNGLACQKFRPTDDNKLPVIKIREMHEGITADTEYVKSDISEAVKVYDGDVLFSWSASLEIMLWAYGNGGLNQHIFKVTSKNGYPKSFFYYQLIDYIGNFKRMAEARKTTMGHITQEHLQQSTITIPSNVDIAKKLEAKLKPIFEEIILNSQEITRLTKQRDEFLSLLMNGQVSVNCDLSHG